MTRVACVQLEGFDLSKDKRIDRAVEMVERARNADLIVLPELWPVGFFHSERYSEDAEPFGGAVVTAVSECARTFGVWIYGGSFVERTTSGDLHNCGFLVSPEGHVELTYRKVHLFGYGSEESRLLTPGREVPVTPTPHGVVGATTCYDLRFPELYRDLVDSGMELALIASAWPAARLEHWLLLLRARAVENQIYVIACNVAGEDAGTPLAGNSLIVGPTGEILAQAGDREEILWGDIQSEEVAELRKEFPVLGNRRYSVVPQWEKEPEQSSRVSGVSE